MQKFFRLLVFFGGGCLVFYKEEFNRNIDIFHLLYNLRTLPSELCKLTFLKFSSENDDDDISHFFIFPFSNTHFQEVILKRKSQNIQLDHLEIFNLSAPFYE